MDTQKLSTRTDSKNLSITSFENLANEIYYEIFDYLDGYDIYKAFSGLNTRFQQLITSSSLLLKISLDRKSEFNTEHLYKHFVIPNKHRIISFYVSNQRLITEFFKYAFYIPLKRLESIVLHGVEPLEVISYLSYLTTLPRLFSLTIELDKVAIDDYVNFDAIYRWIFRLPYLKYNSFSVYGYEKLHTLVPSATNGRFCNIEFLVINHKCTTSGLISIFRHTPRLTHLTCKILSKSSGNIENEMPVILPHLTHITVFDCDLEFVAFETFIKKISSQLKVLHIRNFWYKFYRVPKQWEQLISQHMPHLLDFHLRGPLFINSRFQTVHFNSYIHQLTLQFWLERGWNIRFKIVNRTIFFEIRSNRTANFISNKNLKSIAYFDEDGCDSLKYPACSFNQQMTDNSSAHFPLPIEISITDFCLPKWNRVFSDKLNPVFIKTEIRSLYLDRTKISIYTFIELLRLLPNLVSLKMSSSFDLQTSKLSNEYAQRFRLLSYSNNITKISQWMKFKQVKLCINLCLSMEYLEVSEVKERDLEKFIHFILKKIVTNISHLQTLRLNIYSGTEETVRKLHKMINSEKRLSNYTIKYVDNNIFLQSKLERFIQFDVNFFPSIE